MQCGSYRAGTTLLASPGPSWHVAITQPNGELTAEEHLKRQATRCGWQPFLPLLSSTKISRGAMVTRTRPYFTGYIFIHFDPENERWRSINGTRGIKRLITCAEVPTRIRSQTFMQELLALCDGQIVRRSDALDATLRQFIPVGSKIKLSDGAFAGFPAKVEMSHRDRVDVLVMIFGRETKVKGVLNTSVELVA